MLQSRKCAIIGCGYVGATTAYSLMSSGLFSEIVLIDIDTKKAAGEAADIGHGVPFNSPTDIYAGDYNDISDCRIIIITAGANQRQGQTRLDLIDENVKIFHSIVSQIKRHNNEAIIIVVTNPVDVLTYVTLKISEFPESHVIGSGTVLDTARLKYLIGRQLGVDSRNVHSFIIGEHGDSEFPVFSSANISGIDIGEFCKSDKSLQNCDLCGKSALYDLFEEAKNSAYHIIESKGATYYAIAESVKRIVSAIMKDEDTIMPISTLVRNYYGIGGICMGIPCMVGKDGVHKILQIPLDENEIAQLRRSAEALSKATERAEAIISRAIFK